jgi:uncharacterized protein DUF4411
MPYYWLDSNVMMEAHRRYYGFDIAPGFWNALENFAKSDILRSPVGVLKEILVGKDELTKWAKKLENQLFVKSGQQEQQAVGNISQQVLAVYPQFEASRFLAKTDPWVIAHALIDGGTVVTQEILAAGNSQKVKIPNVCNQFNVPWISTYELLRQLKVKLN